MSRFIEECSGCFKEMIDSMDDCKNKINDICCCESSMWLGEMAPEDRCKECKHYEDEDGQVAGGNIMNVEINKIQVAISDIKTGDCFERGDSVCIKTNEADPDGDIQVVDLHTGVLHRYPPDNMVTPVKAMLKVYRDME